MEKRMEGYDQLKNCSEKLYKAQNLMKDALDDIRYIDNQKDLEGLIEVCADMSNKLAEMAFQAAIQIEQHDIETYGM